MTGLFFDDGIVQLWHGDCREFTDWLTADVLVTDPPYGIGWNIGRYNGGTAHAGIEGDSDTAARDAVLAMWRGGPAIVFGASNAAPPEGSRQTLVWAKPPDSGIFGTIGGWRRDWEAIHLIGPWASGPVQRSSVIRSRVTSLATYTKRGHPHGKPVDVLERLVASAPPGVIADPFVGSGSTLIAARNQGRRAIGVEIEEKYCEIAARRLSQTALDLGGAA